MLARCRRRKGLWVCSDWLFEVSVGFPNCSIVLHAGRDLCMVKAWAVGALAHTAGFP